MRAAVAARVSSVEQDAEGKTSIEQQLARCRAEIGRRGWSLDERHVFVDRVSGDYIGRFEAPLAAARNREVDVVVFTRIDRFARNLRDLLAVEEELRELGVMLVATDQPVDTSTAAGRAQFQMMGVFAELDKAQTLERLAQGAHATARNGGWPGGEPPYGITLTGQKGERNRRPVLNPAEVEVIQAAWRMLVVEGRTTWQTAAELNATQMRPRKAARWDNVLLRTVLSRRSLVGEMTWAKPPRSTWAKPAKGERGHRTTAKYGGPVEMQIPAVLTGEEWRQLQTALARTAAPTPRRAEVPYLLSGARNRRLWMPCGGWAFGVYRGDRDLRQYRCRSNRAEVPPDQRCDCQRVDASLIETWLTTQLAGVLTNPDLLNQAVHRWMQPGAATTGGADDLDGEIAKLERSLSTAYEAGLRGGLDAEALAQATANLRADLETLRQRQAESRLSQAQQAEIDRRLAELPSYGMRAWGWGPQEWRRFIVDWDIQVTIGAWVDPSWRGIMGEPFPVPWLARVDGLVNLLGAGDAQPEGACGRRCRRAARR